MVEQKDPYQLKLDKTLAEIDELNQEQIMEQFKLMGCPLTLEELQTKLKLTYNELSVADWIFETYPIDDTPSPYAKEFIDEGLIQLLRLEPIYGFTHYGLIAESLRMLADAKLGTQEKVKAFEEAFRKLFVLAKKFDLNNFDGMMYQIHDGMDLQALIVDYLDELMELGRTTDKRYYQVLIDFIEKFRKVFKQVNPYFLLALDYELAQALIAKGNKQGEKMFLQLLEQEKDKTDVVLHYALAYLDEDERKAQKIIQRYRSLLDRNSDAYEVIEEMLAEIAKNNPTH